MKAALASEPKPAWEELQVRGSDVVSAQLFADGLFQLRSGTVDTEKRLVTVQLESLMVPTAPVLQALGAKDVQDACQPGPSMESGVECGYYPDQNCAPDDCWDPMESCKSSAAERCQDCKRACTGTCGDCQLKCGTRNRNRTCKGPCDRVSSCVASCQQSSPDTDVWTCVDRCDNRLPESCSNRCLFQFQ